jgi:hypothetical protein
MHQSLHHLVADAPWSDLVLLEQVRGQVTRPAHRDYWQAEPHAEQERLNPSMCALIRINRKGRQFPRGPSAFS